MRLTHIAPLMLGLLVPLLAAAQDSAGWDKKVTEVWLRNGLLLLVVERHDTPDVSFHTAVKAGWVDDRAGETGLARLLEWLAFKGTETIGTRDWPTEKAALDALEEAHDAWDAERYREPKPDESRVAYLESQYKIRVDRAQVHAQAGEFSGIVEQNGGAGLTARSTADAGETSCTLPSSRTELWFLLESQRLMRPVLREFYKERDAAAAARTTVGADRLLEVFTALAFTAHPYRNPAGGWPADAAGLRRADARRFLDTYYVPANMAISVVGDVTVSEVKRLAERYFGPMPSRPAPPPVRTIEPAQTGPRSAAVEGLTQPVLAMGFKRPEALHPDQAALEAIRSILWMGRSAWIEQELVERLKLAQSFSVVSNYPGGRFPGLFALVVVPAAGKSVEENETALSALLARLSSVDSATLGRAKKQYRAGMLRQLASDPQMAAALARSAAVDGDWRRAFTTLEDVEKVTVEDIRRVAARYFVPAGRTLVRGVRR